MTIPFEKLKARLLANPRVKAEYDALAPEFEIAAELLRVRLRAGLLQAELAARMGTSQSTIARLESGQTLPSTKTLQRYAEAAERLPEIGELALQEGAELVPQFRRPSNCGSIRAAPSGRSGNPPRTPPAWKYKLSAAPRSA